MSDRGSVSLEAAIGVSLLLMLMALFFAIIYGSFIQSISYAEAVEAYLRLNHETLSERTIERELSLTYTTIESDYRMTTFGLIEDTLPLDQASFHEAVEYMTFITDTGSKFHRPYCPTVKLSLRPIPYDEAVKNYQPCRVCRPKK